MRLPLLLLVLLSLAAPAYADGARESRYGPTTPRQANVAATARYDGPMLGWSNKRTAAAPTPAPAPVAYAPQTYAPQAYASQTYAPATAAAPLPASLYAAPTPAAAPTPVPAAAPGAKDWSAYRSARVSPAATTPQPVASAETGGTGARFYSVDRDYGLTPDRAPAATPDNRVLIATTEPPPEPKDAVPMHGSADWLAAGVAGDDDQDDSASRRAKTRNEAL